jgi:hypothetical protein
VFSTLTDLFNVRIGASRKAVFLLPSEEGVHVLLSPEKLPLKEAMRFEYRKGSLQDLLDQEGVEKESLYCVLPPGSYFRNRIILPFSERQKIEGVIGYEIREYLPDPEGEYLTDFYNFGPEVYCFTVEKGRLDRLIEELGPYRENLRSVAPYDTALMHAMQALIEEESYVLLDMGPSFVYLLVVEEGRARSGVAVYPGDLSDNGSEVLEDDLRSELIMVLKTARPSFVYLNARKGSEALRAVVEEQLRELDVSFQEVPHHRFQKQLRCTDDEGAADALPLFGALQEANIPQGRVNLLKGEYKPRMKGYVSVREFSIAGVLLLVLLVLATSGLALDIRARKSQVNVLRDRVREMNSEVYGRPDVTVEEAKEMVGQIEARLEAMKTSTDRRFSGLQLLKELSLYIPQDVVIEYSDIIIERDFIKFSGKARTFSDIDRIREGLQLSEYFSSVAVSNTGTTGSTEGFTVTFVFDIEIVEELGRGD